MFERQIKGIIAVSVILAAIPFISFLWPSLIDSKAPVLSTSDTDTIIIEVVEENGVSGVFFVKPGTSVKQLFSQVQLNKIIKKDIQLQNGMKVRLIPEGDHQNIVVERMDAPKRLALGLPLDINLAGEDDLMLIPGVGDVLSVKIVEGREKIGRFEKLEQLMDIKGIKEKKLSKLRPYLYVDKLSQ